MLCKNVMKTDVTHVTPEESARSAAALMRDEEIGFLPVVDSAKHVIGVVTDRDLVVRLLADGRDVETAVSEAMSDEVVAVMPDDDVRVAAARMATTQRGRIVVLDDQGALAGVISLSDVVGVLGGIDAAAMVHDVVHREAHRGAL